VALALDNLPFANGDAKLTHYRIDAEHSNAYEAWKRMGSPRLLSDKQFSELEKAGQLALLGPQEKVRVENGRANVQFNLPRQAVTLLVVDW
jgi:xylan 1,4-beta-xylosidase